MSKTPMEVYDETRRQSPSYTHEDGLSAVAAHARREALEEVAPIAASLKQAIERAIRRPNDQFRYVRCHLCDATWWDREEHRSGCDVLVWRRALLNASPGSGTLGASDAALLPGLREALKWKPNTPQLENAMTYAWESALKSFIRAIESAHSNASPGSGGQAQINAAPSGPTEMELDYANEVLVGGYDGVKNILASAVLRWAEQTKGVKP